MKLLELSAGGVSLEFEAEEKPQVLARFRAALRRAGMPSFKLDPQITFDVLHAGEHQFILGTEPEESCLIATSALGERVLRSMIEKSSRAA